jgi:hypothetical protein
MKKRGPREIPFSQTVADIICQYITEGMPLSRICMLTGIPGLWVIRRWRHEHPDFNVQIREARNDRARLFRDLALDEAKKLTSDNAASASLRISFYRWAAGQADPGTFGKPAKNQAPRYIVDTGIKRSDIEGEVPPQNIAEKKSQKT